MALRVLANWPLTTEERDRTSSSWPEGTDVVVNDAAHSSSEWLSGLSDIDAVVGHTHSVNKDLLDAMPNVQMIHLVGHGLDGLLRPPVPEIMLDRNIRLATANAAGPGIAEYVIMSMIALNRRILPMHQALSQMGEWNMRKYVPELGGSTMCVVGLGPIGLAIAEKGVLFGMEVVGVGRSARETSGQYKDFDRVFGVSELEEALAISDHVVLALPLTPETRMLFDEKKFQAMKPGACLTNVARGAIVDEDALHRALESGRLAGAAIDVWASEKGGSSSGYPTSRPIHQYNVLMTPHCCGASAQTRFRALELIGENLRRLEDGERLKNEVDADDFAFRAGLTLG